MSKYVNYSNLDRVLNFIKVSQEYIYEDTSMLHGDKTLAYIQDNLSKQYRFHISELVISKDTTPKYFATFNEQSYAKCIQGCNEYLQEDGIDLFEDNLTDFEIEGMPFYYADKDIKTKIIYQLESFKKRCYELVKKHEDNLEKFRKVSHQIPNIEQWTKRIKYSLEKHVLPDIFMNAPNYKVDYQKDTHTLKIEFDIPTDYQKTRFVDGVYRNGNPKYVSEKENKNIIKDTVISLFIRAALISIDDNLYIRNDFIETIDIKIFQDGYDPATGQEARLLILKGKKDKEFFQTINIKKLEPQALFKAIGGSYLLK